MMDSSPLYDDPIHPIKPRMKRDWSDKAGKARSRTERPVKYYHIDSGLTRSYRGAEGPPREPIGYDGDQSVPEFRTQDDCDPFAVDVYRVGNLVRQYFTHV